MASSTKVNVVDLIKNKRILFIAGVIALVVIALVATKNSLSDKTNNPSITNDIPTNQVEETMPQTQNKSSNFSINITRTQQGDNKPTNQVEINGQDVPIPPSGQVHKEITTGDSKATLDVNVQSSGSSSNSSNSTIDISADSSSSSSSDIESNISSEVTGD